MKSIVSIDPFRCRMWDQHDRLEQHIDEVTCRAEIESVRLHGQLVPTLGRRLKQDAEHDVELIYGARRLFVARHLNRPLMVELREMGDQEAVVAMDIENRHRQDISAYERGISYLGWLRSGFFKSQEDIAGALKISASQVCRLIKLAQLPSAIVGAFSRPMDICETWALNLSEQLEDPERRKATCAVARSIAAAPERLPPREVYRQLLAAAVPGRRLKQRRDEVVTDRSGKPLFRIRHQTHSVSLLLPKQRVSADSLDQIRAAVASVMQG